MASAVPRVLTLTVTPTISAASAYASGDNVGGLMTFEHAALVEATQPSRRAYVTSVRVADKSTQAAPLDVFLFESEPAGGGNDNAAFDPDDADLLIGPVDKPVHVTDWSTNNDNCSGKSGPLGIAIRPTADGKFYARAVARGTPTYGSTSDLTFLVEVTLV